VRWDTSIRMCASRKHRQVAPPAGLHLAVQPQVDRTPRHGIADYKRWFVVRPLMAPSHRKYLAAHDVGNTLKQQWQVAKAGGATRLDHRRCAAKMLVASTHRQNRSCMVDLATAGVTDCLTVGATSYGRGHECDCGKAHIRLVAYGWNSRRVARTFVGDHDARSVNLVLQRQSRLTKPSICRSGAKPNAVGLLLHKYWSPY
jgi:hypothetical protein